MSEPAQRPEAAGTDRGTGQGPDDPWGTATADDAALAAGTTGAGEPEVADTEPGLAAPGPAEVTEGQVLAQGPGPATPGETGFPDSWPGRESIREPPHAGTPARRAELSRPQAGRPPQARGRSTPPPGSDLLTGLERWVIRSTARNVRREVGNSVRAAIGSGRRAEPGDIWGTATTEQPPDLTEAPECAWCPVCRGARRMRESSGGLSSVSDAVAAAVQDAFGAIDGVLSRSTAATGRDRPADSGPHDAGSAGDDHAERAPDEPGDRG